MYGKVDGYALADLPDILLERKIEMSKEILQTLDVIEPGYSRIRGVTLYELHAPMIFLARSLYESGMIDKKGLRDKLEEAAKILEEASNILCLEADGTPERILGEVAKQSLGQLRANMDELIEKA